MGFFDFFKKAKSKKTKSSTEQSKNIQLTEQQKKERQEELRRYKQNFESQYNVHLSKKIKEKEKFLRENYGNHPPNYENQNFAFEKQSTVYTSVKEVDPTKAQKIVDISPKPEKKEVETKKPTTYYEKQSEVETKKPTTHYEKQSEVEKRNTLSKSGKYWTYLDKVNLEQLYQKNYTLKEIAKELQRTEAAITAKIRELDLEKLTGRNIPPSTKQIDFIKKLGGQQIPKSRIEASRLIDELKSKPTTAQLVELDRLGYSGNKPKSWQDANKQISKYHPPRDDQLEELNQLEYHGKRPENEFDAFQKIQSLKLPTESQIRFLERNHWKSQYPTNRLEASKIITKIKSSTMINSSINRIEEDVSKDIRQCPECDGNGCDWCEYSGSYEDYKFSSLHDFNLEYSDNDDDTRGDVGFYDYERE